MYFIDATDLDGVWEQGNDALLWAKKSELDYISSIDTMRTGLVAHAESAGFTLDIGKDLWLTPVRWSTLIRQYIDPVRLDFWLDGCEKIGMKGRGINAMDFQSVGTTFVDGNPRADRRKWGGCLRMATFRTIPSPTVSIFSRTSYFGYIAGLDLIVAHKLAEQVAAAIDLETEEIAVEWHCDVAQFHSFKSNAYIISTGQQKYLTGERPKLEQVHPTWKMVRTWWKRLARLDEEGVPYSEMKYGAEIRIRRRYHASIGEESYTDDKFKPQYPLSTPIEELTFAPLRRK